MVVSALILLSLTVAIARSSISCPQNCTCAEESKNIRVVNCSHGMDNIIPVTRQPELNTTDLKTEMPKKTTESYINRIRNWDKGNLNDDINPDIKISLNITKATAYSISMTWLALNNNNDIIMEQIVAFELAYNIAGSENVRQELILPDSRRLDERTNEEETAVFSQHPYKYTIEDLHPRSKFIICVTAYTVEKLPSREFCKIVFTDRGDIETIFKGEIDLKIQIGVALGCIFGVFILSCVSMCVWISRQRCNSQPYLPPPRYARTNPIHQV
ncbi:uncharacterized protein LOC144356752 [Saccoglossus kowalevskii]